MHSWANAGRFRRCSSPLAKQIVARGLNVRQVEQLTRGEKEGKPKPATAMKDADTRALEAEVSNLLGLKVSINHRGAGGMVMIVYKTLEQLDELLRRLSQPGVRNRRAESQTRSDIEMISNEADTPESAEAPTEAPAGPASENP